MLVAYNLALTENRPNTMVSLSFILVNWNCLAFTEQCVAAIYRTVTDVDFEVIVVDNASGDAPCQGLADRFPAVRLILSRENLGFGGANNLAGRFAWVGFCFFSIRIRFCLRMRQNAPTKCWRPGRMLESWAADS